MAKPIFALLLLMPCGPVFAQHYFPTNWPFADLQKLEKPCVFAWRTEMNKRYKPVGDTTLSWCFCYDKLPRRMDAMHWAVWPGEKDTLIKTDLHRVFDTTGGVLYDTERTRMSTTRRDTVTTIEWRRTERDVLGQELRRVRVQHWSGARAGGGDTLGWVVDSFAVIGPNVRKRTTYSDAPDHTLATDSTILVMPEQGSSPLREIRYTNGDVHWTVTRAFENGRLINRLDSAFGSDGNGHVIGFPLEEAVYEFKDSLLVKETYHNWTGDEDDDSDNTWLRRSFIISYVYDRGALKKIVKRDERGRRVLGPDFERNIDPDAPYVDTSDPFLRYDANGLPLAMCMDCGYDPPAHLLRFEYSDVRPTWLLNGRDFDHLGTWEPPR